MTIGVVLGPVGFGKSRLELAAFVVVFVAVSVLLAARALRPSVPFVNTMNQVSQDPMIADAQLVVGESNGRLTVAKSACGAEGARFR